jgi:hypothetical protein
MDSLGRLLLRLVLVPLGYLVAVVVATLVIVFGSWKLGEAAAHPDTQLFAMFGFVFAAPVLLVMLLSLMWLPAAIGILISETFAIRSFLFHAGNGAVSAWIGWNLFGYVDDTRVPLNEPLTVIAAGLAGRAYLLGDRGLQRRLLETGISPLRGRGAAGGLTSAGNPLGNPA